VPLLAVVALVPGTDPHKRGNNPLSFGENEAGLVGLAYLMLVLVPLTTLPAVAVVTAGLLNDNAALLWSGVPVGIASGLLCAWLFGRIAYRRLEARGPELLQLMRVGVSARAKVAKGQANPLPRGKAFIVGLCWSLCWLPLFPQGIVPLVVKLTGSSVRSWFLALYLPPIFQWPVIFAMIALGSAMFYAAIAIQREHDRKAGAPRGEALG
jgi:ABC-2 type transport system permease protein